MAYVPEEEDEAPEAAPIPRGTRIATPDDQLSPETPEVGDFEDVQAGDGGEDIGATALGNQSIRDALAVREANEAAKQRQLAKNPFLFSNAIKPATRREVQQAQRSVDVDAREQLQEYRRQQIDARRQAAAQRKAANFNRTEEFRSKGMLYRLDVNGVPQPVVEASTGRQLFHASKDWERAKHPKDGRPALMKIDRYGQPQYKDYPMVESNDPTEGRFYYDLGDGETVPAMTYDEAAASKDPGLAKKGLVAVKKKVVAERQEALAGMEIAKNAVMMKFKMAESEDAKLGLRIQQLQAAGGDPEEIRKLRGEQYDIQEQIREGTGPLRLMKDVAETSFDVEKLKAQRDAYLLQRDLVATNLRERGIDPLTNQTFVEHEKALSSFNKVLAEAEAKEAQLDKMMGAPIKAAPAAAPAAPTGAPLSGDVEGMKASMSQANPVLGSVAGSVLDSNLARQVMRGATSDGGIYSVGEGLARMLERFGPEKVSKGAKWYADATATLRDGIRRALPVDQKSAESIWGGIAQGVGQLGATTAFAVAGRGTPGIIAASLGQIYDEGFQDAKQAGMDDATAHRAAIKYLPAAVTDVLADRLVVGKLLKPLVGKMTVKQLLKDVLVTGASEGGSEAAQTAYQNFIAKFWEGYDPNRKLTQDMVNAFAIGAAVGGGATTVGRGARMIGGEPPAGDAGQVAGQEGQVPPTPQVAPPVAPQVEPAATPSQNFPTTDQAPPVEQPDLTNVRQMTREQAEDFGRARAASTPALTPEQTEAEFQRQLAAEATPNEPATRPAEVAAEAPAVAPTEPVPVGEVAPINTPEAQPEVGAAIPAEQPEAAVTPLQEPAPVTAGGVQETAPEPVAPPATTVATDDEAAIEAAAQAQQQPRPLPENTQFLYEQNGVRYYQIPDAEAARGTRTVDEATLRSEGFDTANLPTEAVKAERDRFDEELQAQNERIRQEMASRPIGEQDPDFWVRNEVERMALEKGLSLAESREMHRPTLRKMIKRVIERQVYKKLPIHKNAVGETNAHKGYLEKPPRGYKLEGDYYVYTAAKPTTEEPTNAPETRIEPEGNQPEYTGTAPRTAVPENGPEVRQGQGEQAGGGNRVERGQEAEEAVQPEVATPDFDAQETKSGTTYQYKLVKEGGKWTAKIRIAHPDGKTFSGWESGIGVGTNSNRAKVAERFAERFPDAAAESQDADIAAASKRITERKGKAQAEQAETQRKEQEQRDRLIAFQRDVKETKLPKGANREIEISSRDRDGNEGTKKVSAVVYGDWAIYKNENQYAKQDKYLVAHVPSGLKARGTENLAKAKELVQAFILSGVDASKKEMKSDNASLRKLSQAIMGIYGNQVPEWYGAKPTPKQAKVESVEELKPAAMMKRDELRAELRAAGVETVSGGVPVDQAAPNQLMAAVGKLRQGKLEETKGKRTSDKVISALQKAKFQKPGQVTAQTPFTLAWDSAIDLAILGVRAGRAINDVVKLALDRFKARYPGHTPEDLTKLEAAMRAAVTEPPPTPPATKTKESKVSESLRERGAPVEPLEYDVRNQEERAQEAAAIIKKEGVAAAENRLTDASLPRDTRVALGGDLLARKMLEISTAKAEDLPRLTRDLNRIAARMRPELATESGQAISMFNRIYQDVSVAAGTDYANRIQKERLQKMGGEEANKAADEVKNIVTNKKLTPEQQSAEIEKLKKRYSSKPVQRVLTELKRIEVLKKLNDLGALTREDLLDTAANALGVPGIDPKKLKHLAELADKVKNAKTFAEKSRAELELADTLHIYKGVKIADLETSILTLNILSGFTTQIRNLAGNTMQSFMNLATTAATNPKQAKALVDGLIDGLELAKGQAASIMLTGRGTRDFQSKTHFELATDEEGPLQARAQSPLATVDYTRDFGVNPKLGKVLTARARAIERISRFMKAADAVFYYTAREAYARMMATKLLESDYKGAELDRKVDELLHVRPEDFKAARDQAAREGFTGVDLGRRVADMLEDKRRQTAEGRTVAEQSEQFGSEATFTNEPVGFAGIVYRNLNRLVQEGRLKNIPVLKPFMMFLRTPTNVFNATMNYTPIGAARATFGMSGETKGTRKDFTKEERDRLYLQSMIGTALMGGLMAALADDKDIGITAKGPADANKRKQLMDAGWKPYSIKVGNTYVSYRDSPLLVPLAVVGNVADSIKYKKSKSDMWLENRIVDAIGHAPQVIFETSMLSGLGDLMAALSGTKSFGPSVGRTLGSIPANLVIPYNRLLQQIDQTFDSTQYDANQVVRNVPFARRSGEVRTDIQGRPETYTPIEAFGSIESKDPVDKLLREKDVFIPDVSRNVKLGKREMTEDERNTYRRISGQLIRNRIQRDLGRLKLLEGERFEKEIERIVRDERERVRDRIRISSLTQPAAAR